MAGILLKETLWRSKNLFCLVLAINFTGGYAISFGYSTQYFSLLLLLLFYIARKVQNLSEIWRVINPNVHTCKRTVTDFVEQSHSFSSPSFYNDSFAFNTKVVWIFMKSEL